MIDLGGTWIRAALIEKGAGILQTARVPTGNKRPAEAIIEDIVSLISKVSQDGGRDVAIGIGVPTTLTGGNLDSCPNLPTMINYPLEKTFEKIFKRPAVVENDANCFALGEWVLSRHPGERILVCFTLGTSIGLSLVLDGKLLRGASGRSGEIWRSPVDMDFSENETPIIDVLLSGQAFASRYAMLSGKALKGSEVLAHAVDGDSIAIKAYYQYGAILGKAICWVRDIIDPDRVVLGGAIAEAFGFIYPGIISNHSLESLRIDRSEHLETSAFYGAAELVFQRAEGALG